MELSCNVGLQDSILNPHIKIMSIFFMSFHGFYNTMSENNIYDARMSVVKEYLIQK